MKFLTFRHLPPALEGCFRLLLISLLGSQLFAAGQQQFIRLRTETITTSPRAITPAGPAKLAIQAPASGLFLIQLESAPDSSTRAQLRAAGVDLLKYVPENAFVAKFSKVAPETLNSLPFVRWVGPYRQDHKIHPGIINALSKALPQDQSLPVNVLLAPNATPAEVVAVRASLAAVTHESHLRQGVILQAQLLPSLLNALASSDSVLWIEPAPKRKLVDEAASKIVGGDDGLTGTRTVTQKLGFGGAGVTVAIADTGLDSGNTNTMHPDLFGRVTGFKAYGDLGDAADEYGHGTHAAGIIAGNAATGETDPDTGWFFGLGVAADCLLFGQRIFDSYGFQVEPLPTDEELTHDAYRAGARIGSYSWGTDNGGEYDTDASQFDELVRDADASSPGDQPFIQVFAAGNTGPNSQTIYSPATGKNVLSVGASQNTPGTLAMTYGLYADGSDVMADFSSRGPCQDGRLKPDVVAPGTWISSLASSAAIDIASVAWMTNDQYYVYMGGTSMAGPHGAGAAAVFVQYYKSLHTNALPSPALVKAALINSSTELDQANGGPGPSPNFDEGWGRLDLTNIVVTNFTAAPRLYDLLDQSVLLTNTQVYIRHALVRSSAEPLKITLAYTDPAGFPGALPALVNDLDLEVVAPDGTLYRGNQFADSVSVPNATQPDNLNNVEGVRLVEPTPGDYIVRVRARSIVEDARFDTAAIDQDFALVISGDLTRPGTGTMLLDRPSYTAPGTVKLQVQDPARAGSASVSVLLKSTTEAGGENYTLLPSGNYGVFTGSVVTVVGNAAVDGKLQIHNGDAIQADYHDNGGITRTATATADLVSPVITGVTISIDLGVMTIRWQTSEPADSVVRYGTNQTLNLALTNSTLTTDHAVTLRRLVPGRTYYYTVGSTDPAGNNTVDNNSGNLFSFIAIATPNILLVDAYEQAEGSAFIEDSAYTNALAASGYSFSVWKILERGSPKLSDLQAFPAVIWRPTDDIVNYEGTNGTLTASEQFMIQNYLDGGGSFLMASMGMLSQLGDVPFRRHVLQVAGFVQNPGFPFSCPTCDEFVGVPGIYGTPSSTLTAGMNMALNYANYPSFDLFGEDSYGPDFGSTFTPGTNATPILFSSASERPCGMSFPKPGADSPGRVVFLSVPLDTLPGFGADPNTETAFLRNALRFLIPGANGIGTITLDSTVYSLPDRVTVEVGDSDLAGLGQAQVTLSSSSGPREVTITLTETAHPGLFRGSLMLVPSNPDPDQIVAQNGSVITARYADVSGGSNVVALATVDTVPPVISQVSSIVGFGDALVTWTTSKPSDSSVSYGGSGALLDRTAYDPQFVTNHSVFISGLSANRTYFFQVASRDPAGNTAFDDNQGALYTFTTRRAPQPPWFDDLETGAPNWTVIPIPGSEENWSLGTPTGNGLQTAAHSGTNAWGSNLHARSVGLMASSYLLSPIIDLTGMSQATLTFWNSYDFSYLSTFEEGQVLVSTNGTNDMQVLADFSGGTAFDWQEETLDLSKYVGKTIQVIWQYQGVDIGGGTSMSGWLLDDIGITGVVAGQGGTVVVTKNLGQGTYTLTGPLSQSGTTLVTTLTNAPPGSYSISFSDVAFYQTPPPQTALLTSGRTVTLSGNYTLRDTNSNAIADSWEAYYFGSSATNITQTTDADQDGMTDYEEFIAGTNPTNADSKLIFTAENVQANNSVKIQWAAIPGRVYQVQSSTNVINWVPLSDWLRASSSPMSYTVTNAGSGSHLYRVQVRP